MGPLGGSPGRGTPKLGPRDGGPLGGTPGRGTLWWERRTGHRQLGPLSWKLASP